MPGLLPGDGLTEVAAACREHWARAVAVTVHHVGDLDLAEDAVGDAVEAALRTWPRIGLPEHPDAWLIVTARRRAIDQLRRDQRQRAKIELLARLEAIDRQHSVDPVAPAVDDELALILMCCHPALSPDAQVALTLRLVAGLSPAEIARALLVPERTLQQRLVRAKRKVMTAGIPFRPPSDHHLPDRQQAALAVVYLVFNEGYAATRGDRLQRPDLVTERSGWAGSRAA